jgi:site-specific DNA recombinase
MMNARFENQIVPRNGRTLEVLITARISGCATQKEISLNDQIDHAKQVVADYYQGPVDYRIIATKGKGERLDRPELAEIEEFLRTRKFDLFVCEDIGRVIRGAAAVGICGIAVDHGTRVLAPNDCIDTNEASWEEDVISACRDHVGHNSHTSKRLKQKLMNRFEKFGGATAREIFGYTKPLGAKTYGDWLKDDAATPIYTQWFHRLRENPNCSALATWLNELSIPTGKYARRPTWDGKMVRRVTSNSLLKGMPGRGYRHSVKHNESGRRVSVVNPRGPKFRHFPHLAHLDPALFDSVNAMLTVKNKDFGRKSVNGTDPRWQVPRNRTRFPGQHARCWYCGFHFVWGGNGVTENVMCCRSREWRCWNSVGFNGSLAANKLVDLITAELYQLNGFDEQFRELVRQAKLQGGADPMRCWEKMHRDEESLAREKENLVAAIAAYGPKPMFEERLIALEGTVKRLATEKLELERLRSRKLSLPESVSELRVLFEKEFKKLATCSWEFGQLMQRLVPEFEVYLVRLCDGGHPLPRARVKLALSGIVPDAVHVPALGELLTRSLTLDLFESPQRERIRQAAVDLASRGIGQREIARRLPENPTQTAVQRALNLHRIMGDLGLNSPYVLLSEPPDDYPKLRRHRNPKYCFNPRDGYQRAEI